MRYLTKKRRSRPTCRVDGSGPSRHNPGMSERVPKSLASGLVERRGELGLTQQQVADRAGLNIKQIQRLESGKVLRPQAATLRQLDMAYELPQGRARQLRDGEVFAAAPAQPDAVTRADAEDRLMTLLREAYTLSQSPEEFLEMVGRVGADLRRERAAAAERDRADEAG